ncbi:MAG: spore germination protein [Oscillospiraceae bacterium]|nr:spore germination protein [Oscillospiraceae bacterium]
MLSAAIDENINLMNNALNRAKSFDIKSVDTVADGRRAIIYFTQGYVSPKDLIFVMRDCSDINTANCVNETDFAIKNLSFPDVSFSDNEISTADEVFRGKAALLIDGYKQAIIIDVKSYPRRAVSEPEKNKTLRGPHEGFTESIFENTVLIRRRIRTPSLCFENFSIGELTATQVTMTYISGRADETLVNTMRQKLESIKTLKSLALTQQTLSEALFPHTGIQKFSPLPKVRYVERPDTAAAMLTEGKVLIICDTTPSVICLPMSIFEYLEEAEDYYFPPFTGTYMRFVRLFVFIASVYMIPIWILFVSNKTLLPSQMGFITKLDEYTVPLFLQFLIIEIAIDGLKLASLNTPNALSNSLSVVGGLLLGDFAVKSGWFLPQTILYAAFTAIANFVPTNYELGYGFKFARIFLIIGVGLLGVWGFIGAFIINHVILYLTKGTDGKSYLYPLIPFNGPAFKKLLFKETGGRENK